MWSTKSNKNFVVVQWKFKRHKRPHFLHRCNPTQSWTKFLLAQESRSCVLIKTSSRLQNAQGEHLQTKETSALEFQPRSGPTMYSSCTETGLFIWTWQRLLSWAFYSSVTQPDICHLVSTQQLFTQSAIEFHGEKRLRDVRYQIPTWSSDIAIFSTLPSIFSIKYNTLTAIPTTEQSKQSEARLFAE